MTVKNGKSGKHYDYDGFVEKFKPKKTTDDCYTPPEVYDVVLYILVLSKLCMSRGIGG